MSARTEDHVREIEERLNFIYENASEGIFQNAPDGQYLTISPAFARVHGYDSPQEMMEMGPDLVKRLYVDPTDHQRFREILEEQGFVGHYETEHYRKDGKKIFVSSTARTVRDKDQKPLYYEGILQDITDRKRIEDGLNEKRQDIYKILEHYPTGVALIGSDGKYLYVNQEFTRITGYVLEDIPSGREWFRKAYSDPDYRKRAADAWKQDRLAYTGSAIDREFTIVGKDRKKVVVNIKTTFLKDFSIMVINDVTEQKQVEEALREGEAKYRTLFESANDAILLMKNDSCVDCNSKASMMFGCTKDQLIGANPFAFWPPSQPDGKDSRDKAQEKTKTAIQTGSQSFEWRHCRLDGTVFDSEVGLSTVTIGGEVLVQAIVRDITERKNLEAQLLQAQKMEAIGTLAGGVAHDFNNIIMAMMGYTGLIGAKVQEDYELRSYLRQIQACTSKAANLTRGLLAFSRKQAVELQPQSANTILRDCEKLLRRLVPEDVEFTLSMNEDVTIMADVTQIDQVLMNLISNAKDAMPKGGALRIETKLTHIGQEFKQTHGFGEPGDYALISVSDNGKGMNEATQEKIFEPFFTTKGVGKGTGLGLSIVYGIIKQHNGYITVSSIPDTGTTFDIYFPAVKLSVPEADQTENDLPGGSECLLLAEDDDFVREITAEILTTCGYTVVEAKNGEDAIRKYSEFHDSIDLLLLDVVMPVKNGKQAYDEVRKINPSARALFMSGYTGDVVLDKGIQDTATDYVSKPLSTQELLKKIREVLER